MKSGRTCRRREGARGVPRGARARFRAITRWIPLWIGIAIGLPLGIAVPALAQPESAVPPGRLIAIDTPNDAGASITLRWTRPVEDRRGNAAFHGYRLERSLAQDDGYAIIADVPPGMDEFIDASEVRNGVPYYYRLTVLSDANPQTVPAGPAVSRPQWFHTGRVSMLVAVVLLSALVLFYIRRAQMGGDIFIRKIAGLEAVHEAIGRATEMGRKVIFIPGTSDMDQVQTLAGIAILGRVARFTAEYETALDVPVSRSLVMVACRETVREAYLSSGRPDSYSDDMVYYLTDDQFGYAAALEGIMVREKPAAIFMQGSFYAEALILAETGNSIGAIQIAGTAQATQLPFFVAACDYTLIGEELFAAGAYLSKEPRQLGSLKGQDIGKAVILVLLLIGIVVQSSGLLDFSRLFRAE